MTASFKQVLTLVGFSLSLFTMLTVAGVFILRKRAREHSNQPSENAGSMVYRTFGYPITPIVFLVLSLWTLIYVAMENPMESAIGLGLSFLGVVLYYIDTAKKKNAQL